MELIKVLVLLNNILNIFELLIHLVKNPMIYKVIEMVLTDNIAEGWISGRQR